MTKHIGPYVRQLSTAISRHVDSYKETGISRTQGRMLGILYNNTDKDIFQKDIESALHISKGTASMLITSLEEKGLVERKQVSNDARLRAIVLTPYAVTHGQEFISGILELENLLQSGISQEEIDAFLATAQKMINNLKQNTNSTN